MDFKPLHNYMASLIEKGVPGLELIVYRNHEMLFHECMGYSDYERTKRTTPADRYWMYSCTKPVTVATAMHAIEEGLFQLDDPVYRYLPAYRDAFIVKDGRKCALENAMTVRHLFTMTGGLDYNLQKQSILDILKKTDGQATTCEIANAVAEAALCFEPGERFQYSLCHDVLGAVVEAASGMSFRDYMKKTILDPLGMTRTDFWTENTPPDHLAAQYVFDGEKKEVVARTRDNQFVLSPNYFSGGAGLVSCAEDYIRFTDAMSCGGISADGVRILKNETIDLMRSEQLPSFRVSGNFTCTCGPDYGYGLGVRTRVAFNEGVYSSAGEFGWDGAAGADLTMDPANRLSVVYVQHVMNWPTMLGAVHLQIRDVLYPILGLGKV